MYVILQEVAAYQKKTQEMSLNEISLRTQLNSYMEKYEDFQNTLEKSNQIFHTFKKEMEEVRGIYGFWIPLSFISLSPSFQIYWSYWYMFLLQLTVVW